MIHVGAAGNEALFGGQLFVDICVSDVKVAAQICDVFCEVLPIGGENMVAKRAPWAKMRSRSCCSTSRPGMLSGMAGPEAKMNAFRKQAPQQKREVKEVEKAAGLVTGYGVKPTDPRELPCMGY